MEQQLLEHSPEFLDIYPKYLSYLKKRKIAKITTDWQCTGFAVFLLESIGITCIKKGKFKASFNNNKRIYYINYRSLTLKEFLENVINELKKITTVKIGDEIYFIDRFDYVKSIAKVDNDLVLTSVTDVKIVNSLIIFK